MSRNFCSGKVRYPTRAAAEGAALTVQATSRKPGSETLTAYPCRDHWHIGRNHRAMGDSR